MAHFKKALLAAATITSTGMTGFATADVIAFTDFDGRTATDNTASNLTWTTNGVEDPGDMSAFLQTSETPQNLFDGTTLVQNNFAPGINTGNGNTFWSTDVALTVSDGFSVSVSDVTFSYAAVSGSQVLNVPRESDFIVTLVDPFGTELESDITFGTSGTGLSPETPTLTAIFVAPIELTEPGTYTIRISGGDLFILNTENPIGTKNETGNHTAIDNLSINGTVIPEPSSLALLAVGGLAMVRRRRG
jgi:hypothetical protein